VIRVHGFKRGNLTLFLLMFSESICLLIALLLKKFAVPLGNGRKVG
jgi:hypothetical protein